MRKVFLALLLFPVLIFAQKKQDYPAYRSPMNIPIYLSGTFAELRSNHFHSGIDIRTQGMEGQPVFAVGDGYVSRVAVSPGGFGKAIYVNHPEGFTSVYAHLQRFSPEIEAWVKQQQYAQKNYTVNLYVAKDQFFLKKGQQLGLSGNSGSSAGPHLHFEIRDGATQEPLNPLHFGYEMKDYIRPAISTFAAYPLSDSAQVNGSENAFYSAVEGWGEQHRLPNHQPIYGIGELAFGISVIDQHNDTPNKNGVYSVELKSDNQTIFKYAADRFSFTETRYINSFIDYAYFVETNKRIIRSQRDPLNKLRIYEKDSGTITLREGDTVQAEFLVMDFNKNISRLPFLVIGRKTDKPTPKQAAEGVLVKAGTAFELRKSDFYVEINPECFYRDEKLTINQKVDSNYFSSIYTIGDQTIPVHKSFDLGIRIPKNVNSSKLYMVLLDRKGKAAAQDSKISGDFVTAKPRVLGEFTLLLDTLKPEISAINFKNGKLSDGIKTLKVKIKDEQSGIDSYEATLNGSWLLMAYDAKNDLLIYEFDERLKKGENQFTLQVTDKVGNTALLRMQFIH